MQDLTVDCELVDITLTTFDSAFVTDADVEANAMKFPTEN